MRTLLTIAKVGCVFRHSLAVAPSFFATFLTATTGIAQQTDADFNAYCRANFNNSAYQATSQTWGTEHSCVQGGTRQGIDLSAACALTTGNKNYEISGSRVLCDGNADDAPLENANDAGEPDFNSYCNDNFPNSSYEKRAEATGVKHYCRRPGSTGGYTLQPVDLAEACQTAHGVSNYRVADAQIVCTSDDIASASTGTAAPLPFPLPMPMPFPQPNAFPEPTETPLPMAMIGTPTLTTPNIETPTTAPLADPGEAISCKFMGGKWHSGTQPLVDEIIANKDYEISRCQDTGFCNQVKVERSVEAYMNTLLIYQCHQNYFLFPADKTGDDLELAIKEACQIEIVLNDLHEEALNNGAFLPPLHYMRKNAAEMAKVCDCKPDDPPDFANRVDELRQQAEQDLIAEFLE